MAFAPVAWAAASNAWADYKDDIGYTALTNLYSGVPTGTLATVIQVEVPEGTNYAAYPGDSEFVGKSFTLGSGPSGNSGHATDVGRRFYGTSSSISPGITNIWNFEANHWIGAVLRVDDSNGLLNATGFRVINHSWIGSISDTNLAAQTLRRTDVLVDRDDVTTVVGVNNGGGSIPQLLGNAYNVLAVGLSSGSSSSGPSTFDTAGRAKPDIVAPLPFTSYSTPIVAGAAVVLTDSAIMQAKSNALKPVVVKSLLMTGAEKLVGWNKGAASPSDDHSVPLDYSQGAGELQIDRSYQILQEPEAVVGATDDEVGWDLGNVAGGSTNFYFLTLDNGLDFSFTATLNWNRHVTAFDTNQDVVAFNNLDFLLYDYSGSTFGSLLDFSTSVVDNVEHLYLTNLLAGSYALGVVGSGGFGDEEYGVSWQALTTAIPEASAPSLFLIAGIVMALRRQKSS